MDLVDPFREQNPNRIVWSSIGNENSRRDRVCVDLVFMEMVTNINGPPFMITGFCLNTSLFEDEVLGTIVQEAWDMGNEN